MNEEPETFDDQDEAYAAGNYCLDCFTQGGEGLYVSNPGDYPLSDGGGGYFDIVEV